MESILKILTVTNEDEENEEEAVILSSSDDNQEPVTKHALGNFIKLTRGTSDNRGTSKNRRMNEFALSRMLRFGRENIENDFEPLLAPGENKDNEYF